MKNLSLIFIFFALISCSKKEDSTPVATTGQVTFYMGVTTHNWNLLVDNADKGALRGTSQMPVCGDPAFITLTLSLGVHSFDAKSLDGLAWGQPVNYTVTEGCHQYKAH